MQQTLSLNIVDSNNVSSSTLTITIDKLDLFIKQQIKKQLSLVFNNSKFYSMDDEQSTCSSFLSQIPSNLSEVISPTKYFEEVPETILFSSPMKLLEDDNLSIPSINPDIIEKNNVNGELVTTLLNPLTEELNFQQSTRSINNNVNNNNNEEEIINLNEILNQIDTINFTNDLLKFIEQNTTSSTNNYNNTLSLNNSSLVTNNNITNTKKRKRRNNNSTSNNITSSCQSCSIESLCCCSKEKNLPCCKAFILQRKYLTNDRNSSKPKTIKFVDETTINPSTYEAMKKSKEKTKENKKVLIYKGKVKRRNNNSKDQDCCTSYFTLK
ncbi:hypothetical protein ABK040_014132 [Willaertia magna]